MFIPFHIVYEHIFLSFILLHRILIGIRCRLPPGKSSSTSFTCFAFCLREWLSCRNMANFSFAILLLDYLTRRQGTFSLRRCLQTLDHLMQELLRVSAAFSRSCGYCFVFLVVQP